jgi:diketogulonate reductase-like aldo/keto reductase
MKENMDIFDFELSKADIEKIKELDRGKSPWIDHRDPKIVKDFNEEII